MPGADREPSSGANLTIISPSPSLQPSRKKQHQQKIFQLILEYQGPNADPAGNSAEGMTN